MLKKSILVILFITFLLPVAVSADLWSDLDNLATSTYTEKVGFPFASTSDYTEAVLTSTYVFPLGFLDEQSGVLISWFIILTIFFFAFKAFKFTKT